jgi:hypothetical protein
MKKNHGILNFVQLCDTEILQVMRNFVQFRTEYGRDGSTSTVVEKHTDFRVEDIPWTLDRIQQASRLNIFSRSFGIRYRIYWRSFTFR